MFITSRIYGGYAQNPTGGTDGCLSPEPYAYEEGFAVQRAIVAQINQDAGITNPPDPYIGDVHYNPNPNVPGGAPWFDWGPYLWAAGPTPRSFDQLVWCNGQGFGLCPSDQLDFRHGDPKDQTHYWGDFTHPTASAADKVANQLVRFIGKDPDPTKLGSPFVLPWIQR
ncbi:MAG: hypothetical protein LAN83_12130 [Acidobacteriia bacterium]|nr:hypothetical protein [Terriglobia bacterium]